MLKRVMIYRVIVGYFGYGNILIRGAPTTIG